MARSTLEFGAEGRQGLMRVLLAIAAVWLVFWALVGGMLVAVEGPGLAFSGQARLLWVAVLALPLALLAAGLIGTDARSRSAVPARERRTPSTRSIGIGRD